MFIQVMDMMSDVLTHGVQWFSDVLNQSGILKYYMALVFLTLLFTYILSPLFRSGIRSGRSDTAKKPKKDG